MLVYEFYRMMPAGFLILNTTGRIRQLADNHIKRQIDFIEEAAIDLEQTGADVVIASGSPMWTLMGNGSEVETEKRIQAKLSIPFATGINAEMEAMRRMGIRKVVVATPHRDDMNERMEWFLNNAGFEVLRIGGLGILRNSEIAAQPFYAAYRLARKLYLEAPEADGVFVHCPRWPAIDGVPLLEREIGKPVVCSSQAIIWLALKRLKIREKIQGWGWLIETLDELPGKEMEAAALPRIFPVEAKN
jgi:maleate isomerase